MTEDLPKVVPCSGCGEPVTLDDDEIERWRNSNRILRAAKREPLGAHEVGLHTGQRCRELIRLRQGGQTPTVWTKELTDAVKPAPQAPVDYRSRAAGEHEREPGEDDE